jgi:hypothetical protein
MQNCYNAVGVGWIIALEYRLLHVWWFNLIDTQVLYRFVAYTFLALNPRVDRELCILMYWTLLRIDTLRGAVDV